MRKKDCIEQIRVGISEWLKSTPEKKTSSEYYDVIKAFIPFSNEYHFEKIVQQLKDRAPQSDINQPSHHEGKTRVAILVGESRFLSSLPEISAHADLVLMIDIHPFMLEQNQLQVEQMKLHENYHNFIEGLFAGHPLVKAYEKMGVPNIIACNGLQNAYERSFERFSHALSIAESKRYQESRSILINEKVEIIHAQLNLFDKDDISSLARIITDSNSEITFANFTNLHHYAPNTRWPIAKYLTDHKDKYPWRRSKQYDVLLEGLSKCFSENILIAASFMDLWDKISDFEEKPRLCSWLSKGLSEYRKRMESEEARLNFIIYAMMCNRKGKVQFIHTASGEQLQVGSYCKVNENSRDHVKPPPLLVDDSTYLVRYDGVKFAESQHKTFPKDQARTTLVSEKRTDYPTRRRRV